ncbi:MAG TPA: cyclic nucleotide-binding domain-containing protein [Hyphomicrobiaceae bacterium]|nr:cyclic nucleotide-binding domain-containing protein [Hyphomicrobiaceae bacterium]
MSTLFSWGDLPGHIAYVILAISYWLTSMFWLRTLACIGLFFEIAYYTSVGSRMWVGIAWDLVFISINLFQLYLIFKDRFSLKLAEAEGAVVRRAFGGLDDAQLARLLRAGSWSSFEPGTELTTAASPVNALSLIQSGRAEVIVDGHTIACLRPGDFIGEIAFLTGVNATATVKATEPLRALVLERAKLAKLCASDGEIATAVYQILGSGLAQKFAVTHDKLISLVPPPAPSSAPAKA